MQHQHLHVSPRKSSPISAATHEILIQLCAHFFSFARPLRLALPTHLAHLARPLLLPPYPSLNVSPTTLLVNAKLLNHPPLSQNLGHSFTSMPRLHCFLFLATFLCLAGVSVAGDGEADPLYKDCVEQCKKSGCVGNRCFQHCKFSSDGKPIGGPWYTNEPLYLRWKQWDCQTDCQYYCMQSREEERMKLGDKPIKYHGKWPFRRVYGIQEPVAVALSALNLAMQFHGWVSFFILVYYTPSLRPDKKTYYEYTGLWHIYGILSMNSWFWSAIFHSRNVELTEKLDHSSAVALLGFSLLLAILRAFNVRDEAARILVAAPLIAFVTTHILYLNFHKLDYGLHMKICMVIYITHLLIWAIWACISKHPAQWKLWLVVVGGNLAMLFEVYEFPPYMGYVDSHALWHATTIPITYFWWSFVREDAEFWTSTLLNKVK